MCWGFLNHNVRFFGFFFFFLVVLLWCVFIPKSASILQKDTLVFSAVSGKYIKTQPLACRRPNGVSLVPFDSPDPAGSRGDIDFRGRSSRRSRPCFDFKMTCELTAPPYSFPSVAQFGCQTVLISAPGSQGNQSSWARVCRSKCNSPIQAGAEGEFAAKIFADSLRSLKGA